MEKKIMTPEQKEKREEIVKGMKKTNGKEFEKRYPGKGKQVMYATATKLGMNEEFKNYYKTRIHEGVLGEQAALYKEQMKQRAFAIHENIMEGFSPEGRELFIDPNSRASYITHFTSFIKEQFNIKDITWKEAKMLHNRLVEERETDETANAYCNRFADFMNRPSTRQIVENVDVYLKPGIMEDKSKKEPEPEAAPLGKARDKSGRLLSAKEIRRIQDSRKPEPKPEAAPLGKARSGRPLFGTEGKRVPSMKEIQSKKSEYSKGGGKPD